MAINRQLHDRIKAVAEVLRREVYGSSGTPTWGTRFTEIEDLGVEIGDLLAREVIAQTVASLGDCTRRHGESSSVGEDGVCGNAEP